MPLTKQQIAIKCYYEGRRKTKRPPRDKIVLGGKVKLTPRRREILYHVAFTDGIWWREERDWSHRWENHRIFVPYLGETCVTAIVQYLKRHRLIAWSKEGGLPNFARQPYAHPPILLVTARGMDALLECVEIT
ncbi:hypothetical protein [Rhizobium nepotum]|uniref:hypothetical protein n=1 Tax=Rhizobium nepotum TaxID=1035271 RepID=UPI003CE9655E